MELAHGFTRLNARRPSQDYGTVVDETNAIPLPHVAPMVRISTRRNDRILVSLELCLGLVRLANTSIMSQG